MKKRIFSLLLSCVLSVGLLGTAFAMPPVEWDNSDTSIGPQAPGTTTQPTNPPIYNPPSDPSHSVTNSNSGKDDNGSWSTNRTSAKKGDTVTVTVKPNEGYQGVPTVKDKDGKTVPVTKVNDTTYTFVMPNGKVTVSVEFTPVTPPAPVNPFTDVNAERDSAYYDAILWAVEKGTTTGTGDGTTFSPYDDCTRAQNVTFLWRALGKPVPTSSVHAFTDVDANRDSAYYDAILWAVEKGVTSGTGTGATFSPYGPCTRAQFVTFLWRALGKPAPTSAKNPFTDVNAEQYAPYYDAILWAVEKGITTGTGTGATFSPDRPCTRAQVVTFLYRALAE